MAPTTRRYRNVECGMWDSADFLALSSPSKPNGQHLWQFLLTGPQTGIVPGLYCFSVAEAAERFRWPLAGTSKCFMEILDRQMAIFDEKTRVIWLPKGMNGRNLPASPNVVRSWRSAWKELPSCNLKTRAAWVLLEKLEAFGEGFAKAFREILGEPFLKGRPHPSPIQESGTATDLDPDPLNRSQIQENLAGLDHARARSASPSGMSGFGGSS
jgi:hypothetical protein